MTRVADYNSVNRLNQTECWNCGTWFKNSAKACPFCHNHNDDYALSNFGQTTRPNIPKPERISSKICPRCKKEFTVSGYQKKKYCSKDCSDASQRTGFDQKAYMKAYYLKRKAEKLKLSS